MILTSNERNKRLRIIHIKKEINNKKEKYVFPDSKTNAPIESGMNKRKENFAAFSLSKPNNKPDEIVIPLLETPGKSASA